MRADGEGAVGGLAPAAVDCPRAAGSLHERLSPVRYARRLHLKPTRRPVRLSSLSADGPKRLAASVRGGSIPPRQLGHHGGDNEADGKADHRRGRRIYEPLQDTAE